MREITMRPTRSLVRAALSASLLSTLPLVLGVSAMLAECSLAIAGDNVLKQFRPVTDEMLQSPDPGDWLMRRGDYRAWGYSALDQIRAGNVGALKLAWAWNMEPGYQEEAPLVHDGVIFLANPQNVVQALDGRTGDLLWEYRRELPKIEGGYHNDLFDRARGTIALYADKVFLASADAHVVALDARTGKVVWDTTVADYRRGYTFTGGPMVAKGKVIAGISGCTNPDTAGGCFIVALDADTGAQLWRTQTIAQPGSPGDGAKRRIGVDDRQLRPVPQLAVLGHGRPHSAYRAGARHRGRGGLVHRFNARARRRHRQDRLAPPVSAPRQLESRSCVRADSRGHQRGESPAAGAAGNRKARHHLGARPAHRRIPVGARNNPPDRVQEHRSRNRKGHHQREPDSQAAGAKPCGMSVVLRRQIMDGDGVQSGVKDAVPAVEQFVHGLQGGRAKAPGR